jgi:hypothetical protein
MTLELSDDLVVRAMAELLVEVGATADEVDGEWLYDDSRDVFVVGAVDGGIYCLHGWAVRENVAEPRRGLTDYTKHAEEVMHG